MHNQFEEQLSSGRHSDHQEMMRAVPAMLKIDFRNGYNSTCRGKMLAQVEAKVPHLLRFARYLYAQRTKFVVMHKGQLVEVIESAFGSQQGDPLGGHFFALSIYDFMKQVRDEWPTACISWVVDDLTVVDTQERLLEVARMVDTEGPEYGLFKHDTKGEIYSPHNVGGWTPFRAFTHTLRYKHASEGFDKPLLGALVGQEAHEQAMAADRVKELMAPIAHLKRIQDTQLEFVLLKYCSSTVPMHLCRMVAPHIVESALRLHSNMVRSELDRIVADAGEGTKLTNTEWQWAKLPTREGGLGLHDLPLISEAAYVAALAAVARRAIKIHTDTGSTAANSVARWFHDDNDGFEELLARVAAQVNGGDAPNSTICPSIEAFETMPSQAKLSHAIYQKRTEALLADPSLSREDRAWMRSRVQFNAGKFLQAIPMTQKFQCSSLVFKIMLQLQMGRKISGTEGIKQCALWGAHRDSSFKTARHPLTTCKKGKRVIAHDKLRDIIHKMYQELGIGAEKEVRGLFSQLTSDGDHRPADVLVPPSATGGELHWALDVTITDPTNKTNLERHSDTRALAAATRVHNKKLEIFRRQLEAAGPAGLQFEKKPLAFEATGAMGKETQEWWKGVVKLAFGPNANDTMFKSNSHGNELKVG